MEKKKRVYKKLEVPCSRCLEIKQVAGRNLKALLTKQGYYSCRACAQEFRNSNATHFKGTPIHNSYAGARQRCNYTNHIQYHNYGGRGIKFLWLDFNSFYEDMSKSWFPGATLERKDVNGNYCKDNCTWITRQEQCRNTTKNIHNKEQILKIREMYETGKYTQKELSSIFKDSTGNISNILTKRTWKF